jgi:multiple sugar transport system permease protein
MVLSGVAAAASRDLGPIVMAWGSLGLSLAAAVFDFRRRRVGALVGALAINALLRITPMGYHGFTAMVAAAVVIPVQTGLALVFAVLLNQQLKGIRFFRTFFFMPVVFPMALVAVIWRVILDRSGDGLLNSAVETVTGGTVGAHNWLGSGNTAMLSVIVLSVWQGVGFQMVIILAALQEIPEERYEAARLDRANVFQQFRYITVPGVRNTLIFVVLLTTIFAFRVYDQVYILITTAGGNENALRTVLYQATNAILAENSVGQAAAISVVLFLIIVVITLVQRAVLRQRSES